MYVCIVAAFSISKIFFAFAQARAFRFLTYGISYIEATHDDHMLPSTQRTEQRSPSMIFW